MSAPVTPWAFIVGGGATGEALARRLSSVRSVVLVDRDPERARVLADALGPAVRVEGGDGTSGLFLRRAGADRADVLVAAVNDDEATAEVARIAREDLGRPIVVAALRSEERAESLRRIGVEVVRRDEAVAAAVEARIAPGRVRAANIGLGRGELVEVTLLPTSPIVGRRLADSTGLGWRIGALYRGDELFVPSGETVPEPGDRVIVVSPPDQMEAVAEFISAGTAEFPFRYGTRVAVVSPDGLEAVETVLWAEVADLLARLPCREVRIFARPGASNPEDRVAPLRGLGVRFRTIEADAPVEAAVRRGRDLEIGLFFVPPPPPRTWIARAGLAPTPLDDVLDGAGAPVVIARNGGTYRRVVLAASGGATARAAAECAFDLARTIGVPLAAIAAAPPAFIGGAGAADEMESTLKHLAGLAALFRVPIETDRATGNPVREVLRRAADGDLVVVGRRIGRQRSFFRPDVASEIAHRARTSVLVFPVRGGA